MSLMRVCIDDGSTNIKLAWLDEGEVRTFISPNSFKPEWSFNFAGQDKQSNYQIEGEHYSFDPNSADAVNTTDIRYQYSPVNVVAIHHALHHSGLKPCAVDVAVTLPLSEYLTSTNQPNLTNIEKKKQSVMRSVTVEGSQEQFVIKQVTVLPESIPAGFKILSALPEYDSLLIVDLGGTTLDISHVRSKMAGITRTGFDPKIGVSIVTDGIRDSMKATTRVGPLQAEAIYLRHKDTEFLTHRLYNETLRKQVLQAISDREKSLIRKVVDAIQPFSGYTHVMCVGGGAPIIAQAVKAATDMPDDRFFIGTDPQIGLVTGMLQMREGLTYE